MLVTTLTKKMAEDLTEYMREVGIRVKYLHSDIDTLEGQRLSGICGWMYLMCWWELTFCGKDLIYRKLH